MDQTVADGQLTVDRTQTTVDTNIAQRDISRRNHVAVDGLECLVVDAHCFGRRLRSTVVETYRIIELMRISLSD